MYAPGDSNGEPAEESTGESPDRRADSPGSGTDRALSPVVGVILLIAITVLLVASAGAFVFGFTDQVGGPNAPTVALGTDSSLDGGSDTMRFRIKSGQNVASEDIQVVVSGASCGGPVDPNRRYTPRGLGVTTTQLTASATLPVTARALCRDGPTTRGPLDLSSARISVVWAGSDGASGTTYTTWTGPDA